MNKKANRIAELEKNNKALADEVIDLRFADVRNREEHNKLREKLRENEAALEKAKEKYARLLERYIAMMERGVYDEQRQADRRDG